MKKITTYIIVLSVLFILFSAFSTVKEIKHDFWFDEAYTNLETQKSFGQIILEPEDVHPPLYYVMLKSWSEISGYGIRDQRAFSFLMMCIYLFSIGYITRKLYGMDASFVTTCLVLVSSTMMMYSAENRMYTMSMILVLWTYYTFIIKKYWWFVGLLTASLYTHYFNSFILLPIGVYTLVHWKELMKTYDVKATFNSLIIVAFFCVPLIVYFFNQNARLEGMWLRQPTIYSYISGYAHQFFIPSSTVMANMQGKLEYVLLIVIVSMYLLIKYDDRTKLMLMSYIWVFTTIFLVAYFGIIPYHHRFMLTLSFLLYIPLGHGIVKLFSFEYKDAKTFIRSTFMKYMIVIFLVFQLFFTIAYFGNPNQELQTIGAELNESCKVLSKNVLHESPFSQLPLIVYAENCNHYLQTSLNWKQLRSAGADVIPQSNINNATVIFDYYIQSEKDYLQGDPIVELDGISLIKVQYID